MKLSGLLVLMLLLSAPLAAAHSPPAPILTCQPIGTDNYHDYGPAWSAFLFPLMDGNLSDCAKPNPIEVGLGICLDETQGVTFVCEPVNTGVEQPIWDYDGEIDYAGGGALLFYTTGDGQTSGVMACYGWPSVGHHTGGIYALDVTGNGPEFVVTSDYSRSGLEQTPDCGDNMVEPCDPTPPVPSTQPFPVNLVFDTVNDALYQVFGPGGDGCNVLDCSVRADSTTGGPSHISFLPCGPGADGAITVFVKYDTNTPVVPLAGHIWTTA